MQKQHKYKKNMILVTSLILLLQLIGLAYAVQGSLNSIMGFSFNDQILTSVAGFDVAFYSYPCALVYKRLNKLLPV